MTQKISLKIMTPQGIFWNTPVDIVTVKTTEGFIGLQYGRSPFVASLDIAELFINSKASDDHKDCAVAGGIVFASKTEVSIITDAIEYKENIDLVRAKKSKEEAESILKSVKSEDEEFAASLALKKAINRIQIRGSK